jgi:hypothetical protein
MVMFRNVSRLNVIVLVLISLALGGLVRFAFNSSAATNVSFNFHISPAGGGKINHTDGTDVVNCPTNCAATYVKGTKYYHYKATAAANYQFAGWAANPRIYPTKPYDYTNPTLAVSSSKTWTFVAYFKPVSPGTPPVEEPPAEPDPPVEPEPQSEPEPADTGGDYIVASDDNADTNTNTGTEADTETPTTPEGVTGEYSSVDSSTSVSWEDSSDNISVSGYEVQRQQKGTTTWEQVGNVATAQYTDFKFAPNKTYIYQVRAYDEAKNFSAWSVSAEVTTGDFKANVTVAEGGKVTDSTGVVTVEVPKGAVSESIIIVIKPVKIKGMTLPKNTKLVGTYYDIKAKKSDGTEVKNFNRQITVRFNYSKINLFGATKSSLAISNSQDTKTVEVLPTALDGKNAQTLTSHLSIYFLSAEKTGFWGTLAWILVWVALLGGVIAGGYFGWQKYMLYKYKKEHKEDFIYKH